MTATTRGWPIRSPDRRADLEQDRAQLESTIREADRALGRLFDAQRDVAADDEHDPEGPTLSLQRAEAEAMLAQSRRHLDEVEAAIARMDDGSYGVCVTCGRRIPDQRLRVRPFAEQCVACAERSLPRR